LNVVSFFYWNFVFLYIYSVYCDEGTFSGALELTPYVSRVRVARFVISCVMFCRLLFVLFLLATVLSVRLRLMASACTFVNFEHFHFSLSDRPIKFLKCLKTNVRFVCQRKLLSKSVEQQCNAVETAAAFQIILVFECTFSLYCICYLFKK
jgi:hypothetical protein